MVLPKYDAELDEAAAILKNTPCMRIRLEGHTDSNASTQYNQKLSERRVEAVKAAFVKRGTDASRFDAGAFSENKPAAPNDTKANRQLNRRVELIVIK